MTQSLGCLPWFAPCPVKKVAVYFPQAIVTGHSRTAKAPLFDKFSLFYEHTKPSLSAVKSHMANGHVPHSWEKNVSKVSHSCTYILAHGQEGTDRKNLNLQWHPNDTQSLYFLFFTVMTTHAFFGIFWIHCCLAFFLGRALLSNSAPFVRWENSASLLNPEIALSPYSFSRGEYPEIFWNVNSKFHYKVKAYWKKQLRVVG